MGGLSRITLVIRLPQPSVAGVGAGAELGKNHILMLECKFFRWFIVIAALICVVRCSGERRKAGRLWRIKTVGWVRVAG